MQNWEWRYTYLSPQRGGVETGGSQDLAGWQSSRNGVLQLQQETLWQEARWKAVEENS